MKKIIHIDMDAFYASVEQRDNPALRGKPVIVGGDPSKRGVVSTCSYEARRFGIHSAMSAAKAKLLCPKAIFLYPNFDKYKKVSQEVSDIIHDYSNCVEPLSLDEAYIDVTFDKKGIGSATLVAMDIRKRIKRELWLTASAGVSYNKFLAKAASDVNKPDGITVIEPKDAEEFLEKLPIGRFYGIGKVTESRLKKININCGKDLKELSLQSLTRIFGKSGVFYYNIVRGVDEREVDPVWIRKSIARENTFYTDIIEWSDIEKEMRTVVEDVAKSIKKYGVKPHTITVKVKYFDFKQVTRSVTLESPVLEEDFLFKKSMELLNKTEVGHTPARLLGVAVSGFKDEREKKEEEIIQMRLPF